MGIRMTNAQIHADNAVRAKTQAVTAEARPQFKLKRFQNVDPRTSTKRGDQPYMAVKQPGARSACEIQTNSAAEQQ